MVLEKLIMTNSSFIFTVPPLVAQPSPKISFYICKAAQTKIDELELLSIIEHVQGPTN